jgi:hypothetical protein
MTEDTGNQQLCRFGPKTKLLVLAIFLVPAVFFIVFVRNARQAALASRSQGPLNRLSLALHNYHDVYGCLPPAYVVDEDGKPIHSWRALVLPYVDYDGRYKEYRFDEPWDGPKNIKLIDRMPEIFHCPSEPESTRFTNYVAVVGPKTAFPGAGCVEFDAFEDGVNQTILLAEIANSDVAWSEPRDLDVETMSFLVNDKRRASISSNRKRGPYVVFSHSIHAYWLRESLSAEAVRSLTTINGGEPMSLAETDDGVVEVTNGPATDAGLLKFGHRENAWALWLSRSPVTDAAIPHLKKFKNLHHLDIRGTKITDKGFASLKAALPDTDISY